MRRYRRVWGSRRQQAADRVHALAVREHRRCLDRMLDSHDALDRPVRPSEAVIYHDRALVKAHQAASRRLRRRGGGVALDQERLEKETLAYLAARTHWPSRALAEVSRRRMDANEASRLGDAHLATEIVHQIVRVDERADSGDPGLVRELVAAYYRRWFAAAGA